MNSKFHTMSIETTKQFQQKLTQNYFFFIYMSLII